MNAPRKIDSPQFSWRTTECPECEGGACVPGTFGGGSYPCDECNALGWVGVECTGCGDERPLNDDGECADCCALTVTNGDPFQGRMM